MYNPPGKRKGQIGITNDRGRLKLSLPRTLFGGQQKYIHLRRPDTPEYRGKAVNAVKQIEIDIANGEFDYSFEKYLKIVNSYLPQLAIVQAIKSKPELSLQQCWDAYFDYKSPAWKKGTGRRSTYDYMKHLGTYIHECPIKEIDGLAIRQYFLDTTTESMTKRLLTHLNAAVKFGIKHSLIKNLVNPFDEMSKDLKHRYETETDVMALSLEDKNKILDAFKNHKGNWNGRGYTGYAYSFYYPFVATLFLTGRRPEEVTQWTWGMVKSSYIAISAKVTKTGRECKFPLYPELEELLNNIKPEKPHPNDLIFVSPKGSSIDYNNFSIRAWNKVVDPLFPDRNLTPRCARDTFITEQCLLHKRAESVVAKWCDTSPTEIRKRYLGDGELYELRPGSSNDLENPDFYSSDI